MAGYQIIADVSNSLLQRIRNVVCPGLLAHREQISMNAPGKRDNEALLNLYLYSICDHSSYTPERMLSTVSGSASGLPKAFSLFYVVYFGSHAQTPLDTLTEQQVLGKIMQLFHTDPTLNIVELHPDADAMDEPAAVAFQKLDNAQKQHLWSGFSEPMRPALYFEVGPLLMRADNTGSISRVQLAQGEVIAW